jgi:hypothetical protein
MPHGYIYLRQSQLLISMSSDKTFKAKEINRLDEL